MTLIIPQVSDPEVQQALDVIARRFPLGPEDLKTGIVLRLASTGTARKVAFGSVVVTWPGATQLTGIATVTHGLDTTPAAVVATATFVAAAGSAMAGLTSAPGSTSFTVQGYNPGGSPVAGTTSTIYWLAIG